MALTAPFAAAADRASSVARSMGQSVALYAAIGLMSLIGAGFLIAALYLWLAEATSPLAATLVIGLGFLAVSLITLAIVIAQANQKKEERRRAAADTALLATTASLASVGLRIASRTKGPMFWPAVAAIAAGWYFGRQNHD